MYSSTPISSAVSTHVRIYCLPGGFVPGMGIAGPVVIPGRIVAGLGAGNAGTAGGFVPGGPAVTGTTAAGLAGSKPGMAGNGGKTRGGRETAPGAAVV